MRTHLEGINPQQCQAGIELLEKSLFDPVENGATLTHDVLPANTAFVSTLDRRAKVFKVTVNPQVLYRTKR